MTIKQINNTNYSEKDIKKSDRTGSVKNEGVNQGGKSAPAEPKQGDQVFLSQSQYKNELDFARNLFDKLGTDSFSALRKVKKKIANGEYNNKEVHQKISSRMEKELASLEEIIAENTKTNTANSGDKKTLAPEYKQYLIENPKVVKKVADSIRDDLKKI